MSPMAPKMFFFSLDLRVFYLFSDGFYSKLLSTSISGNSGSLALVLNDLSKSFVEVLSTIVELVALRLFAFLAVI